jgi:O-antigen/teichoic acid export membrane protein
MSPDPSDEPGPPSDLARQTVFGALALGARQAAVQGANLAGSVLLARWLGPELFGFFGIGLFAAGLMATLAGSGLATSLVRQESDPEPAEERAVFSLQLALAATLCLLGFVAAPWIARAFGRPPQDGELIALAAASLILAPAQAIPVARLERRLEFARVAAVEATQAVAFNATLVLLAWRGAGLPALGWAFLVRAAAGALAAQAASPWKPALGGDASAWRPHLAFGLPYQGSAVVSLAKDALTPIGIGLVAGAAGVGYVNLAQTLAAFPVWGLPVFQRAYLPAFARLQREPLALARFLERVLAVSHGIVAPLAVFTLALAAPIVTLAFGERWRPALPVFHLLWVANIFVATATPLLALLNALGRSRTTFAFSLGWMTLTWLLGLPLVLRFGVIGYGLANVAVQATNLLLFRVARQTIAFRLAPAMAPAWGWAALVGGLLFAVQAWAPPASLTALGGYLVAALLIYASGLLAAAPVRGALAELRRRP